MLYIYKYTYIYIVHIQCIYKYVHIIYIYIFIFIYTMSIGSEHRSWSCLIIKYNNSTNGYHILVRSPPKRSPPRFLPLNVSY